MLRPFRKKGCEFEKLWKGGGGRVVAPRGEVAARHFPPASAHRTSGARNEALQDGRGDIQPRWRENERGARS